MTAYSMPLTTPAAAGIYSERLSSSRQGAAELVLLPGWSMDSSIWRELAPALRQRVNLSLLDLPGTGRSETAHWDLESLLDALLAAAPPSALYLGWSLGGMLAWELARRAPERVQAVITLGSNPRFVAEDTWTTAMPAPQFRSFRQRVANQGCRALDRFDRLQTGDDPVLRNWCRRYRRATIAPRGLGASLELLSQLDSRETLPQLRMPVLHMLGEHDQLVPAGLTGALAEIAPRQQVRMLAGAHHLLPLCAKEQLLEAVDETLSALPARPAGASLQRSKAAVAGSFDKAACSYDQAATLQRRVGHSLLGHLPNRPVRRLLDLGCGTGYFRNALQQRYPRARYTGIDLSQGMVKHAAGVDSVADWLVGDAEDLPLASHSVELVFSNLVLQWSERLDRLAAELMRVLIPGGHCLVATLGPATLHELRRAWAAADEYAHVNQFTPLAELQATLCAAGLRLESSATEHLQIHYDQALHLLRELKHLGAHNVNRARPPGLTGRRRLQEFCRAYENFREGGKLPASYEVHYLRLTRPAPP